MYHDWHAECVFQVLAQEGANESQGGRRRDGRHMQLCHIIHCTSFRGVPVLNFLLGVPQMTPETKPACRETLQLVLVEQSMSVMQLLLGVVN